MLSLISQVFAQLTTRRLYQPAVAGLHYSLSLGTRYTTAVLSTLFYIELFIYLFINIPLFIISLNSSLYYYIIVYMLLLVYDSF